MDFSFIAETVESMGPNFILIAIFDYETPMVNFVLLYSILLQRDCGNGLWPLFERYKVQTSLNWFWSTLFYIQNYYNDPPSSVALVLYKKIYWCLCRYTYRSLTNAQYMANNLNRKYCQVKCPNYSLCYLLKIFGLKSNKLYNWASDTLLHSNFKYLWTTQQSLKYSHYLANSWKAILASLAIALNWNICGILKNAADNC